jgi:hypothetical protein
MFSAAFKKWQHSWSMALALLAVMAWCMPVLAMSCAVSVMPPAASLHCNMNAPDVAGAQQMPCCQKIPIPPTPSQDNHLAFCCLDGNIDLFLVSFPKPYAPLWALVIASPKFPRSAFGTTTFYLHKFSHPPSLIAYSTVPGRAPPFLV